jgi:RecA/RadA recombinase
MAKEKPDPFKVSKDLIQKHGEHLIKTGAELIAQPQILIPISPIIDLNIGGGIPEGSVCLLSGDEKCGKTVTALQICKNAQRLGKNVYYMNIEARLKPRDMVGIHGLDPNKIIVVGSYREDNDDGSLIASKILSGEEWLAMAENYLHNDPGCVVVLDSISQLVTAREIDANIGDVVGDGAYRLMSQFIGRMQPVWKVNRCVVVGVQHLTANTRAKPGQKTKVRTGGRKVRYAVDVDLICTHISPWTVGNKEDGEQIGQIIHWKTASTSILPPGRKFDSKLRYGVGLDEVAEYFEVGKSLGFITSSGAWYTLSYLQNHLDLLGLDEWKVDKKGKLVKEVSSQVMRQGEEKILQLLADKPEFVECLQQGISEMLGV